MKLNDVDFTSADIFVVTCVGMTNSDLNDVLDSQFTKTSLVYFGGGNYLFMQSVKSRKTDDEIILITAERPECHVAFTKAEKWVKSVLDIWLKTSKLGRCQILVTSLDYFFVTYMTLAAAYGDRFFPGASNIKFCFIGGKYGEVSIGKEETYLDNNPLFEEFDRIYDVEQCMIYDDGEGNKDG